MEPLAQGVLADTYTPRRKPKDSVRKQNDLFSDHNLREAETVLRVLRGIARVRGKTVAQVALSWLAKDPLVVPIPGAKRPAQAEENAGAAEITLSREELRRIEAASRRVRLETF